MALRSSCPSSGSSASKVRAVVGPIPGTLRSRFSRSRQTGLACTWSPQSLVQVGQLRFQPGEVALNLRLHRGQSGIEALPLGGQHLDELPSTGQQGRQFLRLRVGQRTRGRVDHLGEARQDLRIEHVGLGQLAHCPGEVAHLAGIDHRHRQPRRRQRGDERDPRARRWPPPRSAGAAAPASA